jgi:hypothetical protein
MTKCVATAVTRMSRTSGRSRDTVWNIGTSYGFLRQPTHRSSVPNFQPT